MVGLPVEMALANRRFDFSAIADPRWRLVAKELDPGACSPRAIQRSRRCRGPIAPPAPAQLHRTGWKRPSGSSSWLASAESATWHRSARSDCEAYLAFRRYLTDERRHRRRRAEPRRPARGRPGHRRPGQLPGAVHRRPGPAGLRPWGGATASAVAEMPSRADPEQDPAGRRGGPAADARRRPAPGDGARPARCRTGPTGHAQADRVSSVKAARAASRRPLPSSRTSAKLLDRTTWQTGTAAADARGPRRRRDSPPDGPPTTRCSRSPPGSLARQAGYSQLWARWMPALRGRCEDAVASAGVQKTFARERGRGPGRRRQQHTAVDPAAAPIPGRRPGRHRPHRGDHRRWPPPPACGPAS